MERYLIEVVIFQGVFLGVYWLFFRKSTHFTTHRLYLLLSPVLAMILPLITIPSFQSVIPEKIVSVFLPEVIIGSETANPETVASDAGEQLSFLWIYYLGLLISFGLFVLKMSKLRRFIQLCKNSKKIIDIPQSTEAFTFLNYIFIGEDIDTLSRKHILAHERIHVKQKHTWDLLAFEALRIIMWFNPLVYIYQKEIARVHEYLADEAALRQTSKQDYYEKLLNTAFGTNNLSFTNTFFNHSSIKNRIVMLQKSKSSKNELFKYLLIVPMILGMLFYVSCSDDTNARSADDTEVMAQIRSLSESMMRKGNLTEDEILALKFLSTEAKEGDRIYLSVDEFLESYKAGDPETVALVKKTKLITEIVNVDPRSNLDFSEVDEAPLYSGCDSALASDKRKECFTEKMDAFIAQEFDTSLGDTLGLEGIQRIYCLFKISPEGNIVDVRVRAPHPDLEKEARRVISNIPTMEKGAKKDGKFVTVSYTKPIAFKIEK